MNSFNNPPSQGQVLNGTFIQDHSFGSNQNFQANLPVGRLLEHLMQPSSHAKRPRKLSKVNLLRQITYHYYRHLVDANDVHYLEPCSSGPVLIMEAEMVAPIFKQIVADTSNLDVSDQNIRDSLEITRREQSAFGIVGNGRTWLGENGERYIALDGVVMMFPSGQEKIIHPQQHYPYWHPTNTRPFRNIQAHEVITFDPADIRIIESFISLPKDRELLVYTFIILCMMPDRQQLALELTGGSKKDMSGLQSVIKNMVDPVKKETSIRDIPTTVKEVNRLAWRHQVISLESVDAPLSPVVQRRLRELLCNGQLEWKASGCNEITTSLVVSRPCIVSSLEPTIFHDELAALTLSLEMPSPSTRQPGKGYRRSLPQQGLNDEMQIKTFQASIALLGKAHANIDRLNIDRKMPDLWHDFCRIGMIVSEALNGCPKDFWTQFDAYRSERLCEMSEEEPVAQAIIEYIKINMITESVEKPAGVWLATLQQYRPAWAPDSKWPHEPRGIGAAFKRSAPLLEAQGITCYSNGKRGSKRHWVIGPKAIVGANALRNKHTSGIDREMIDALEFL